MNSESASRKISSAKASESAHLLRVVDFFEDVLSRPPCEAGMRLRSECDVADLLGIHRMKVQRSFNCLVDKGILVRRKGSGTFIRKVPQVFGRRGAPQWEGRTITASDLLAEPAKAPVRKQSTRENRRLNLALIAHDWSWQSDTASTIIGGVQDRAKQEGHHLKIHSVDFTNRDPEARLTLIKKLRAEQFDGCILWTLLGSVLKEAFGEKHPPAVFIGGATRAIDVNCVPMVRTDLEDSTIRALYLLAQEGYQRIGFIGYDDPVRGKEERFTYEDTLDKLGLSFRSAAFCPLETEGTFKVIRRMFSGEVKPDAIYVADDVVLRHAVSAFRILDIVPGKNIGTIVLSNKNNPLPPGFAWSCLEFNQFQLGRMALDNLLLEIQTAGETVCSFAHIAAWLPKGTHKRSQLSGTIPDAPTL